MSWLVGYLTEEGSKGGRSTILVVPPALRGVWPDIVGFGSSCLALDGLVGAM